jgi:2-(3-amino-3-carboxypropyl)histidine synthase
MRRNRKQAWEEIGQNPAVLQAMKLLPSNYEFEIPKTLWKILSLECKIVALQFPEGLLMYACIISDIVRRFTGARVIILSDVTYGACCIDDYTAAKLNADCLIHYGHSCLVPISSTCVKTLYVFVEINFSTDHLIKTLKENFDRNTKMCVLGTVQFLRAVQEVKALCADYFQRVDIPQVKPLSQGETLGCTSPLFPSDTEVMIFLADGRFHMESAMIRNPNVKSYRYDPYSKKMTLERYDQKQMMNTRL